MRECIKGYSFDNFAVAQKGATCGIYAVWVVYNYFCTQKARELKYTPRESCNKDLLSLRHLAKVVDYTMIGEIFSWVNMEKIARINLDLEVSTIDVADADHVAIKNEIIKHINEGHPILLAYEANESYDLSATKTLETIAHWATIVGYDNDKVIAVESGATLNRKKEWEWDIKQLRTSMLVENTWEAQTWKKYATTYTGNNPKKDTFKISQTYKNWQPNDEYQEYEDFSMTEHKLIGEKVIPRAELHKTLKNKMLVIHGFRR